jgi:hypothetical protein
MISYEIYMTGGVVLFGNNLFEETIKEDGDIYESKNLLLLSGPEETLIRKNKIVAIKVLDNDLLENEDDPDFEMNLEEYCVKYDMAVKILNSID